MLNVRITLLVATLLGLVPLQQAAAQDPACSETDFYCIQRHLEIACREETATRRSCEALSRRLENHPFATEIDWRTNIANARWMLAEFATNSTLADVGSVTEEEAANFRNQSKSLFEAILADDADNTEALLAIAQFTNDETVQLDYLRKASQADPGNYIIVNSFVQALLAENVSPEKSIEAAQALEAAFFLNDVVEQQWWLAASALNLYEQSGDESAYTEFRETLAGIVQRDATATAIAQQRDGAALDRLASLQCQHSVIDIFGPDICLNLVNILMQQVTSDQDPARPLQFAEAAATAMTQAEGSLVMATQHPDYTKQFRANFDTLSSSGIESAGVHAGHAVFLQDEPRIAALQKAVTLDPENGHYHYSLGQAYYWRNRWQEAIPHFQAARPLLPNNWHHTLDRFVEQAEQQLAWETRPLNF